MTLSVCPVSSMASGMLLLTSLSLERIARPPLHTHMHTLQPIVLCGSTAAVISAQFSYVFDSERLKMSLTSYSHTDKLHVKCVCVFV